MLFFINWFLNFGPTLGFVTSAKADIPEGEIDIKDELENTFDAGLGIGYKFNISDNAELYLHYQGYNGLISVFEFENISLKNATSAFNVGVIFNL